MPDAKQIPHELAGKVEELKRALFMREINKTAELYREILTRKPDFLLREPVQYDLACVLEKGGHQHLALEAFRLLLTHQPAHKSRNPALRAAGYLAHQIEKYDLCAEYLEEFLGSDPPLNVDREKAREILQKLPASLRKSKSAAKADTSVKLPEAEAKPTPKTPVPETKEPSGISDRIAVEWKVAKTDSKPRISPSPPSRIRKPESAKPQSSAFSEGAGISIDQAPGAVAPDPPSRGRSSGQVRPPVEPPPSVPSQAGYPSPPAGSPIPPEYHAWLAQQQAQQQQPPAAYYPPPAYQPGGPYPPPPGYAYPPPPYYHQPPHPPQPPAPWENVAPGQAIAPESAETPDAPATPEAFKAKKARPKPATSPSDIVTPVERHMTLPPPGERRRPPEVPEDESPEERYDRLSKSTFTLLLPQGRKIHLDAVAELVAKIEGISETHAKKRILQRKGLIFDDLTLDEMMELHPLVKKCHQALVFVSAPPRLRPMEIHEVLSARMHEKGIKMSTDEARPKIRWEDIRLVNSGTVADDVVVTIHGSEPLREFRFIDRVFDVEDFLPNSPKDLRSCIKEFLELLAQYATRAIPSHTSEQVMKGKTPFPQKFNDMEEYNWYTMWLIYSNFAEIIDPEELSEVSRVTSNW